MNWKIVEFQENFVYIALFFIFCLKLDRLLNVFFFAISEFGLGLRNTTICDKKNFNFLVKIQLNFSFHSFNSRDNFLRDFFDLSMLIMFQIHTTKI